MSNLTKEQIDAIKNYSKEIQTIELFVDAVRQNPGEYLSSIGNEGWMNAVREIIQNATDEMCRDQSPCDTVSVEYFEATNRCIVSDNGRALPPEDIVRVYTMAHTSTNFNRVKGQFSAGLHGSGSKCTNAVSKFFNVLSYRLGKCYEVRFKEGKPIYKQPKELPNKKNLQGLVIDFEVDPKIMREVTISCNDVLQYLETLTPLLIPNARVDFIGHLKDGKVFKKTLINKEGVMTFLTNMTDSPLIKPIMFEHNTGEMRCKVIFTYDINSPGYKVLTFANMTPVNTDLSTCSQGFFQGLITFFKTYMNKVYLVNSKRKIEVVNSDCMAGLIGVVDAAHMKPIFSGQAKNVMKNPEMIDFVKQITLQSLQNWSKNNTEDLQKICEFIKDIANARLKLDKEKVKIVTKYKNNSFVDLPAKYKRAESKTHLELFLTEGDSAGAAANAGRDPVFQATYSLRGKIPNVFTTPKAKFLANEEIQGIITILGAGYGKNFDLEKCPFDKVIILADADPDGLHIRTLIARFFMVYCQPLVEDGRLYIGLSPLYNVDKGKKSWSYFIDRDDFVKYVRDQFFKNNTIFHYNKKEFTKTELLSLIENNRFYRDMLKSIGENNAIHPILLEDILIFRNEPFNKIKSLIEKKYPYLKVKKENGGFVVDGVAFDRTCTVVVNSYLITSCKGIIYFLDRSEKRYIVNGRIVGLYELLDLYTESEPKNIERAKGLGALSPFELGKSTLDPNNRKLMRYTIEDIIKEIEEMRKINDDKYSLIKDLDLSQFEF